MDTLAWFHDKPGIPRMGLASGLREALERAKDEGLTHLIVDGEIVGTNRSGSRPSAGNARRSICGCP